jgi:uncharacterized membrane protein
MMEFQCRVVAVVSALLATHSIHIDKSDFPSPTTTLLSQIRLMPIVGVIVLTLPRTKPGLPPRQCIVTTNAMRHPLNMPALLRLLGRHFLVGGANFDVAHLPVNLLECRSHFMGL